MGLAINWKLKYEGNRLDLGKLLEKAREECLKYDLRAVSKGVIYQDSAYWNFVISGWETLTKMVNKYKKEDPKSLISKQSGFVYWMIKDIRLFGRPIVEIPEEVSKEAERVGAGIIAMKSGKMDELDKEEQKKLRNPLESFEFTLDPGSGCEFVHIYLAKYESNPNIWEGASICKTQYADDFIKSHLVVIAILDELNKVGLVSEVDDEGNYYNTRDLNVLARRINDSTQFLLTALESLKESHKEYELVAPIMDKANFVTIDSRYVDIDKIILKKKESDESA